MTAWFWKCRSARCAEVLHSEAKFEKAPPVGFEPTHTAPEAVALSPELWGLSVRRTTRPARRVRRAIRRRMDAATLPVRRNIRARDGHATGRHRSRRAHGGPPQIPGGRRRAATGPRRTQCTGVPDRYAASRPAGARQSHRHGHATGTARAPHRYPTNTRHEHPTGTRRTHRHGHARCARRVRRRYAADTREARA